MDRRGAALTIDASLDFTGKRVPVVGRSSGIGNGIAQGFVDTKLTKATVDNPRRMDAALARIPIGRLGTPDDMAGVALFLASPLAAFVVGQTIIVDGGRLL
ncbi:NAD(P)-dependent dehydrogenase (short-subunit alcohol dehydrogenase family) [Paraburkholderia sp. GAS448]